MNRLPDGDFYDADVWECFTDALHAREPAEVIRDSYSVEGGQVREIFKVTSGGDIEWWVDSTQDNLSAREWTRTLCASLVDSGSDPAGAPILLPADCGAVEVLIEADAPDAPSGREMAMLEQLVLFARSPATQSLEDVPLAADGVWLGLADQLMVTRTPEELADPAAWWMAAQAFRGYVGPFSALDTLGNWNPGLGAPPVREASVQLGEHAHCASPPIPPPTDAAQFRRISVQPVGTASCLQWWTVDLFLDTDGSIRAITLDLWEP